jgi:hypothetical protein
MSPVREYGTAITYPVRALRPINREASAPRNGRKKMSSAHTIFMVGSSEALVNASISIHNQNNPASKARPAAKAPNPKKTPAALSAESARVNKAIIYLTSVRIPVKGRLPRMMSAFPARSGESRNLTGRAAATASSPL